ncbi:MAG: response regulator [Bdellovibrionota bacterium]
MTEKKSFNLLFVEKDPLHRDKYKNIIENSIAAKIKFFPNGQEALTYLQGPLTTDLIIIDMEPPSQEIEATFLEIRNNPSFDTIPIIVILDEAEIEKKMQVLDQGADDYILRKSSVGIIIARIKTQLRHQVALTRLNQMAIDRDLFAAGVLHDIKNIETTIRIVCEFTALKLNKNPSDAQSEIEYNIDLLVAAASKLSHYASDVIKSVRMTDKSITYEPVNIEELIAWACTLVIKEGKGQSFENIPWEATSDLKQVLGDKDFLKLAIFNIVQNSVKYQNPKYPPKIVVYQEFDESTKSNLDKPLITTKIRDYGIGVKKQEFKRMFQPFRRGEGHRKSWLRIRTFMVAKVISHGR